MSKIVLDDVTNSNNITKINENFSKIETELQDKVFYRNNPVGEPNSVDNNIDMNGNTLFNIGNLDVNGISINGVPIVPTGTVVSPIPNPTGQTGKFLKSDGVTSVWQLITNSDLGSLAVSYASSLIGWIQSGTGAVLRTIQDKLRDRISVKDFGAVGDGIADDTVKVQAALTAAIGAGKALFFPKGTYLCTSTIVGSGDVVVYGEGRSISVLYWPSTAATSGLSLTLSAASGFTQTADVHSLGLHTGSTTVGGTGLLITGATNTASDRITAKVVIRDIIVRGRVNPSIDGWNIGIHLINCSNTIVDSVNVIGKVGGAGEPVYDTNNGILYDNSNSASPHPAGFSITNSFIYYAKNGIYCNDFEGGLISDCQIFGVNLGIALVGPSTFPHASVMNCHINSSNTCIQIDKMYEVFIHGNLLYKQLDNTVAGTGVSITNAAAFFSIHDNIFENLNTVINMNAIVVTSGSDGLIDGNIFRRCDNNGGGVPGVGIWLTASSSTCKVGPSNKYILTTTPVLNSGTNNTIASTTLAVSGTSSNSDGLIDKWGSVVVVLDASGDGVIAYPTAYPSTCYTAVLCNGDVGFSPTAQFIAGTLTASTLPLSIRPNPGAVSVRVNYISKGR